MNPQDGPAPPTNVRLVTPGGREVTVDCVYTGVDGDGMHRWEVVAPPGDWPEITGMRVDQFPARTSIAFPTGPAEEGEG